MVDKIKKDEEEEVKKTEPKKVKNIPSRTPSSDDYDK
jgi:hypothetical protein